MGDPKVPSIITQLPFLCGKGSQGRAQSDDGTRPQRPQSLGLVMFLCIHPPS
jgi:hypothetical protein